MIRWTLNVIAVVSLLLGGMAVAAWVAGHGSDDIWTAVRIRVPSPDTVVWAHWSANG